MFYNLLYLFKYCGHVLYYDEVIRINWKAETIAPSEAKARSNLQYQYKKKHGFEADAPIYLTDEIDGPYPINRLDRSDYKVEIKYTEPILKETTTVKQKENKIVEQLTFDMFYNGR